MGFITFDIFSHLNLIIQLLFEKGSRLTGDERPFFGMMNRG